MSYEPGNYVKGDRVKVAKSRKEAVALTFEGYKPVEEGDVATETVTDGSPTVSDTAPVRDETSDESALDSVSTTFVSDDYTTED